MEIHLHRASRSWEPEEVRQIETLDDLLAIMRETGEALIIDLNGDKLDGTIYDGFVE